MNVHCILLNFVKIGVFQPFCSICAILEHVLAIVTDFDLISSFPIPKPIWLEGCLTATNVFFVVLCHSLGGFDGLCNCQPHW